MCLGCGIGVGGKLSASLGLGLNIGVGARMDDGIVNVFFNCYLDIFSQLFTFLNLAKILKSSEAKFDKIEITYYAQKKPLS